MNDKIDRFSGKYNFLSNFYPCKVIWNDERFPSVEHAFQAAKSLNRADRIKISVAPNPKEAKKFGRSLKLRPDWEEVKDEIMYECVKYKFENDDELKQKLLDTKDAELIEGNNHRDSYWGVYKGEGQNKLGKILMRVRSEIKERALNSEQNKPQ